MKLQGYQAKDLECAGKIFHKLNLKKYVAHLGKSYELKQQFLGKWNTCDLAYFTLQNAWIN